MVIAVKLSKSSILEADINSNIDTNAVYILSGLIATGIYLIAGILFKAYV
jgi:hypothetical protein